MGLIKDGHFARALLISRRTEAELSKQTKCQLINVTARRLIDRKTFFVLLFSKIKIKFPKICSVTETSGDVASWVTITWKESSVFAYTKIKLKFDK